MCHRCGIPECSVHCVEGSKQINSDMKGCHGKFCSDGKMKIVCSHNPQCKPPNHKLRMVPSFSPFFLLFYLSGCRYDSIHSYYPQFSDCFFFDRKFQKDKIKLNLKKQNLIF